LDLGRSEVLAFKPIHADRFETEGRQNVELDWTGKSIEEGCHYEPNGED
jgi:hypothetical protein